MSTLSNKIASYAIEKGLPFEEAYANPPTTQTGSLGYISTTFTSTATTPTYSAFSPAAGGGSWAFGSSTTSVRLRSNATTWKTSNIDDNDYTAGIWFMHPGNSSSLQNAYPIFGFDTAAGTEGFNLRVSGNSFSPASKLAVISGSTTNVYGSTTILPNTWYFLSVIKESSTNNYKFYINGNLELTITNAGTTNPSYLSFGSISSFASTFYISNFFYAPSSAVTETDLLSIYNTGIGAGGTNITITETPAIVTALMTDPTIVIVNNDHVEVTTSITVDALMPEALVFASGAVVYSATPLTASAEILDHTIILGSGVLYPPTPLEASAEMPMPPFIGSGDEQVFADVVTASALMVDPTLNITPNYFNIVRQDNPSFFLTDPVGPTSLTNYGYDNWGTGTLQSNSTVVTSPGQFVVIGNGKSITQSSDATQVNNNFSFTSSAANSQADYFQLTGGGANDFTYEFWIYPRSYDPSATLERVILMGSTELLISSTQISLDLNSDEIPNDGILEPYVHTVSASLTTGMWHHIVITGNYTSASALQTVIYHNGAVKGSKSFFHFKSAATDTGIIFNSNAGDLYAYYNGIALYKYVLPYSNILNHYNFVATSSPDRILDFPAIEVGASLPDPTFIVVTNKNFPATPITASLLSVNPSVLAAVGDGYDAELIEVNATFVNPYFYGDPDATITAEAMTAAVDIPQNIYRLDTAYYSYVQTNIAPIRFVTFDLPDSNKDWGSDNDFAQAVPFVYDGTITTSINGLNNNSLLSTGTNYTTNGLIMKESEWDDTWGTSLGSYHSSYWIKRHPDDVGSNGLRIIQSAYSPINGAYGILYQYNNLLNMEMFNGTDYFTATSAFNVNVFDYSKHHIVVNSSQQGGNHFINIYVDKLLAISLNVGTQALVLQNSATYLPPNTETNNLARMSVGALIPPIANTSLPVTPTATKMYIDDVHWAATPITQTGVNNLFAAMPYKQNINWAADVFLSNNSFIVDPIIRTGSGIDATALTASAELVNPTLIVEFDKNVNATALTASAESIEPFSVIGDTITDVTFTSDIFVASAEIGEHIVRIVVGAQPMNATAKMPSSLPPWYDPYRALVLQQSITYPATSYFGYKIGDID